MRRIIALPLLVAALFLTACGADITRISSDAYVVHESDGNYDQQDIILACGGVARDVLHVKPLFTNQHSHEGSAAIVTCLP